VRYQQCNLVEWAIAGLKRGRLAFSEKGRNSLFGANVLAIIVEVDVAALTARGKGPIWAVAAETRATRGAGKKHATKCHVARAQRTCLG
jgi:hypothetical protein